MEEHNKTSVIRKIYDTNGKNQNQWKKLLFEIQLDDKNINNAIFSKINNSLIDKVKVDLTIDVIDFIIDYGINSIIDLIANSDLLLNFKHLLKVDSQLNIEAQKKVVFLIQKWGLKFNDNPRYSIFKDTYESLINIITFPPPEYKIDTYQKYFHEVEINQTLAEINKIKIHINQYKNAVNNFMNFCETQYANPFSELEIKNYLENNQLSHDNSPSLNPQNKKPKIYRTSNNIYNIDANISYLAPTNNINNNCNINNINGIMINKCLKNIDNNIFILNNLIKIILK